MKIRRAFFLKNHGVNLSDFLNVLTGIIKFIFEVWVQVDNFLKFLLFTIIGKTRDILKIIDL